MKYLYCLFLLLLPRLLHAQTNMDSLVLQVNAMKGDTARAMALINVSNKYRVEKVDYPNAKKYAQEALQLSSKTGFLKGRFKATIALGYVVRDMSHHHAAIEQLKKAIAFFETAPELQKDESLHITHVYTYTALADLYTYLPDYANAQQYAFRALELSEKYRVGIGQCWITLSIIFSKERNLIEARKYALKAENYFNEQGALDDLARTYAYLARYAFTEEDFDNAIRYYRLSYETYRKVNSLIGMRIALYNLAEIYLKTKDYERANYFINETIKVNSASSDDLVYLFYINQLKFDINLNNKNYGEALQVGNSLLDLAIAEKNKQKINSAYTNLLALHKARKDTAQAFVVSERISALKDSLYNADMAKSTADLAKKYETEKKEQQIAFLDRENKLNREKLEQETLLSISLKNENNLKEAKLEKEQLLGDALERENQLKQQDIIKQKAMNGSLQRENQLMQQNSRNEHLVRWLLAGMLLLAGIFIATYYRNYKKQQRANQQITKQSEQLKTLMSELHHRVKNNLQVVVSMIRMQARGVDNKAALDALINSENRLQAIALVHEKLYRNNSLGNIELKSYLGELADVLVMQHQSKDKDCKLAVTDSSGLITNLDIAIPLGLIVNELVSNSFKHAFEGQAINRIDIDIKQLQDNLYQLTVTDNGKGLPNGQLPERTSTLGLKLVKLFAEQLNGQLTYSYQNGSHFVLNFKA